MLEQRLIPAVYAAAVDDDDRLRDAAPDQPAGDDDGIPPDRTLGRPAVKEVFENFNDHKTTNAVEPYAGSPADPLQSEIK